MPFAKASRRSMGPVIVAIDLKLFKVTGLSGQLGQTELASCPVSSAVKYCRLPRSYQQLPMHLKIVILSEECVVPG